jgi:hypothetical protein
MIGDIRRRNAAGRLFLCAILLASAAPAFAQETGPGTSIKGVDQRVTSIDEGVNLRVNGANALQSDEPANRRNPQGASKWGPAPAGSMTSSPEHESSFSQKPSPADRGSVSSPDENKPEVTGKAAAQKAGKPGASEASTHVASNATKHHAAYASEHHAAANPPVSGARGTAVAREKNPLASNAFSHQNAIPRYGRGGYAFTAKAKHRHPAASNDKGKMKADAEKLPSGLPRAQNSSSRKLGATLPSGNLSNTPH